MLDGGRHGHGEPRDANAAKKEWHSRRVVLTAVLVTRQVVPCIQRIWFSLTEKLSGTLVPGDSEISRAQLLSFTRTCAPQWKGMPMTQTTLPFCTWSPPKRSLEHSCERGPAANTGLPANRCYPGIVLGSKPLHLIPMDG